MPDLISHLAAGYAVRANYSSRAWMFIFLTGTILPDIVTRPFYILWPKLYWFVKPMHTPAGLLFVALFISGLFAAPHRNRVMLNLLGGSMLHLGLDLLQKHLQGGYALAFPFSWREYDFGLLWPEQTLWLLPGWLLIIAAVIVRRRAQHRGR